jgi:hypothetical protein
LFYVVSCFFVIASCELIASPFFSMLPRMPDVVFVSARLFLRGGYHEESYEEGHEENHEKVHHREGRPLLPRCLRLLCVCEAKLRLACAAF